MRTEEPLPEVYSELKRLAASYLWRNSNNRTLQPTALVREANLKLSDKVPGKAGHTFSEHWSSSLNFRFATMK